ncbi:invasion associated locus B family protein [Mesorhizobium sp. B2-4-12]|uniref:invasion associated locus B family protein n=2 Tax=Mesorhizobium TaxID=68287 RepID=UPI00112CE11A|nr:MULTISPECIES: invasion associated locus B family protein [unclassified Mesorhizobium]TPK95102.1 invasion associated locus B family protein [Mesorhizobium sp. B2-4-12]TPL07453.1 invasion associated locus B family protein [Mesorhizobium sp. B2-4-14]UCI32575.1 invasion associated locus B family protein [Mesorhizobium sp. B4-1-4]
MNSWLSRLGHPRLGHTRLGHTRPGLSSPLVKAMLVAALSAAGLFVAGQANAAQPSGTVRSTHGAWSIICDTPAGATSEQCVMMQNVVAEDRPEMGLSVVVLRTADNKAEILRVLAPLGVLLPNGLGLNVDGKDIGRAYFVRCFQDGCYAEVILEKPLLDTLKTGTSATFIVFQTPEEGIGIPVDLKGFAEGFAALP